MSTARRVTVSRLLGTGAAALALTAVTSGAAWATGTPGGDGWGTKTYTPGKGAGTVTDRLDDGPVLPSAYTAVAV